MDNPENNTPSKDHSSLRKYHLIAVLLSIICVVAFWMMLAVYPLRFGTRSSEGSIIILLMFLLACVFLFHSFIVSAIYATRIKTNRYGGLLANLVLVVILCIPAISDFLKDMQRDWDFKHSYFNQLSKSCEHEKPERTITMLNTMPAEEETHRFSHVQRCINRAIKYQRIDLLEALEINKTPVVREDDQERWRDLIEIASSEKDITQSHYDVLVWLAERGKKFNYRVLPQSSFFDGYNICHTNLEVPVAQQFADLLIAMGTDINAGQEDFLPAVWYCSRFNQLEQLKFLISRGANVHVDSGSSYPSPIGEAVDNPSPEILTLLIQAGAKPRQTDKEDDLIAACEKLSIPENKKDAQAVISLLKNASFRFPKNSIYYVEPDRRRAYLELSTPESVQCFKGFE